MWCPKTSTLLQVIVSIQGLILVDEPYYNEAGYEKQRCELGSSIDEVCLYIQRVRLMSFFSLLANSTGSQQGMENSRMYNEMVVLKLVQSMTKMISSPPEIFINQIHEHFVECGERFYQRIKSWMEMSEIEKAEKNAEAGRMNMINAVKINTKFNFSFFQFTANVLKPDFPLIPASKGFCLTLVSFLENFKRKIRDLNKIS